MSVWKDVHYVDDTGHTVNRTVPDDVFWSSKMKTLYDFDIGDPGDFKIPFTGRNPLKAAERGELDTIRFCRKKTKLQLPGTKNTFDAFDRIFFGLHAVYQLIGTYSQQIFVESKIADSDAEFVKTLLGFHGATGLLTPMDVIERVGVGLDSLKQHVIGPHKFLLELKKLFAYKNRKRVLMGQNASDPLRTKHFEIPGLRHKLKVHLGLNYLILSQMNDSIAYVLTDKDFDRIQCIVKGIAAYRFYNCMYNRAGKGVNREQERLAVQFSKHLITTMKNTKRKDVGMICRAYDVVYHWFLGKKFNTLNNDAEKSQMKKFQDERLFELFDANQLFKMVENKQFLDAQELFMVHRCLPCPDFDQYSMTETQRKLYSDSVDRTIHDPTREIWNTILSNYELGMLIAYKTRHGIFPGVANNPDAQDHTSQHYPHIGRLDAEDLGKINYRGAFLYPKRDFDVTALVKDKAVCSEEITDDMTQEDYMKIPVTKRSQLLDVFSREVPLSMVNLRSLAHKLNVDLKADDKGEAKKPKGRMFFEAPTEWRLIHSEYEEAVANYINVLPQIVFGKNEHDKRESMNYLCAPPIMNGSEQTLFISFDLHRWSPWMKVDVHRSLDAIWERAFDMPHIKHMHRVFSEGHIHYIKQGVHHKLPKMGRDFEGFSGKKLTLFHYAVMRTAVQHMFAED